jgi:hypothetical protein
MVDKQIRYLGSSEFAYLYRSLFNDDAGVTATELINDVCEKLKVTIKIGGSIESKLERLVKMVVEKELLSKKPEELRKAFRDFGIGEAKIEHILDFLKKNGKIFVLPILFEIAGPAITLSIIEGIIISLITVILPRSSGHSAKRVISNTEEIYENQKRIRYRSCPQQIFSSI